MPVTRDPRQLSLPLDEPVTWLSRLVPPPAPAPVDDSEEADRRHERNLRRLFRDPTMTREERDAVWAEEERQADAMHAMLLASALGTWRVTAATEPHG